MAWMTPIVASRKRGCRRSRPGAVIAGLLLLVVFGFVFFLVFNRSGLHGLNFALVLLYFS